MNILTSHDNLDQPRTIKANEEEILKAEGFELNHWVCSGQRRRESRDELGKNNNKTMVLLNQMHDDDNKALGLGYIIEEDKLHVMIAIN